MDADLTLLSRYHRDGDAGAFQALVAAHAGMVFAAARRVTQDAALAEEVAQDTFLALAQRGQSVRDSVAAWLHHVARQKACNALRGELRRQRVEQSAAEILLEKPDASWAEIEPLVDEVIDGLPEELRSLVIGHYLEQRTQQEMARRLGLSQSTVSRQIDAALQTLRDGLKGRGVMCGLGLAGLLSTHSAQAAPASLTASLSKIGLTGTGATTAASFFLIAMTTTTKILLATGTVAMAGALYLASHVPAPTPLSVKPALKAPVAVKLTPQPPSTAPRPGSQPQQTNAQAMTADERELIMAEFLRMGGTIKEKFIDEDIQSIIKGQFGGDKAAFEQSLAAGGLSFEQFKTQRREMVIVTVMKQKTAQGITDPVEKKRVIDDWLMDLRLKSLASPRKAKAAVDTDE